jgi:hypothetical protein
LTEKYVDVRFTFIEVDEGDYIDYDLETIHRLGTNIDQEHFQTIGECLAQSDRWNVGAPGAVLDAMASDKPHSLDNYW